MMKFSNLGGFFALEDEDGGREITGAGGGTQTETGEANAHGEAAEAPAGGLFGGPGMLIMWGLIIVGMWLLLIRPQRKREKQVREMQAALKKGENIITTSGFYGKIVDVSEDAFLIEFGERGGMRVWVRKSDIAGPKSPSTAPQKAEDKPAEEKKEETKEEKRDRKDKEKRDR